MSAYVVKDKTINRVVTWLAEQRSNSVYHRKIKAAFGLDLLSENDRHKLAEVMFSLNCAAVRQRYEDADQAQMIPSTFKHGYEISRTIQVYKSLRCWHYQCCEGEVPETSILYTIMGEILAEMAHEIVCDLPAYEKAEWD